MEQPLTLLQRVGAALLLGNIAGDFGGADNVAALSANRGDRKRNRDGSAALAHATGYVMLDALAATQFRDNLGLFEVEFRRNQGRDRPPDHFIRGIAEGSFCALVPTG